MALNGAHLNTEIRNHSVGDSVALGIAPPPPPPPGILGSPTVPLQKQLVVKQSNQRTPRLQISLEEA